MEEKNSNDMAFLTYLIGETQNGKIVWGNMPYAAYLWECDRFKISIMTRDKIDVSTYFHVLERKQYPWDLDILVFRARIDQVNIFFIKDENSEYSIPKVEYALEILFHDCSDINNSFHHRIKLEDDEKEYALLSVLLHVIKKQSKLDLEENAQKFMKEIINKPSDNGI